MIVLCYILLFYIAGALIYFMSYCVSDLIWWFKHKSISKFRPDYIELAWVNVKLSLLWPGGIIYMLARKRK